MGNEASTVTITSAPSTPVHTPLPTPLPSPNTRPSIIDSTPSTVDTPTVEYSASGVPLLPELSIQGSTSLPFSVPLLSTTPSTTVTTPTNIHVPLSEANVQQLTSPPNTQQFNPYYRSPLEQSLHYLQPQHFPQQLTPQFGYVTTISVQPITGQKRKREELEALINTNDDEEMETDEQLEFSKIVRNRLGCCWVKNTGDFCGDKMVTTGAANNYRRWRLCKTHRQALATDLGQWENFLQFVFKGDGIVHFQRWLAKKQQPKYF